MLFYLVMLNHWIADFIFQTRKQATNKSTSNYWLAKHVCVYTLAMMLPFGWRYALINGAAHFCTDWVTSRGTSYFWKKGDTHSFFAVIGFDQFLHMSVLLWSLPYVGWC